MSTRTLLFTDCVDFVGSACKPFAGMKKYVSTGAVDVDHINDSDTETVDYDGKPSRANLEVMAGDVLFAKMQGTKKTLLIDSVLAKHIYSTGFCAVRAKKAILTERCLYHILTSEMFLSQKDKNCSGATQKAITNAGLGKIVIHVPSVEEQNIIADQLDAVICIITKRQQELSALDNLIKARFVEMFGAQKFEKKQLIKLIQKGAGLSYGIVVPGDNVADGIPMVRPSDFKNGSLNLDNVYRVASEIECKYKKTRLLGDEILVQVIGQPGQVMLSDERCKGMNVTRNLAVIRIDKDKADRLFISHYLSTEEAQRFMFGSTNQSTLKQLPLNKLKELPVPIVPLSEQRQFAKFVKQVDKSKAVVQKALDEAQVLFDSLMQQYFG